jgi:hypothetical protein
VVRRSTLPSRPKSRPMSNTGSSFTMPAHGLFSPNGTNSSGLARSASAAGCRRRFPYLRYGSARIVRDHPRAVFCRSSVPECSPRAADIGASRLAPANREGQPADVDARPAEAGTHWLRRELARLQAESCQLATFPDGSRQAQRRCWPRSSEKSIEQKSASGAYPRMLRIPAHAGRLPIAP